MYLRFLIVLFIFFCSNILSAQSMLKDSVMNAFPAADMKQRFGNCSAVGPGMKFKVKKNFIVGLEGHFLFGGKVKDDQILNAVTTREQRYLIGTEGVFENYTFSERGFHVKAEVGKIIAFKKPNVNSGIYVAMGMGMLQHKIRIEVDEGKVPYLDKEYKKGYDRLSNGFALSQFIGYRYFSQYRFLNFFFGMEFIEAFTKNRRTWNFDTNSASPGSRFDMLYGFKAGLVIPVYRKQTEKYYYY
jgi:hypothetical protein